MAIIDSTVIIADDLTGANDTALQFFKNGNSARIVIDCNHDFENTNSIDVWSISTESRNTDKAIAVSRVVEATGKLKEHLNTDNFYKKIDSTLRGNTGLEIIAMLEAAQKEVAIVAPAYIEEGRTTIGGYQLLNGIAIERTQCALDPKAPIFDSFIPDILKKDLNNQLHELIDVIGLNVVTKGAGPIALKINELVQNGKKIIITDAMSNTDLEQIALAINKSSYDILPCGSAGLANAMNKIGKETIEQKEKPAVPDLPKFIVSGSATQLTLKQIGKLKEDRKDIVFFDLVINDIINGVSEELVANIVENLNMGKTVAVHSSYINKEILDENDLNQLIDAGIAKNEFPSRITDFLANLTQEINQKSNFILIIVGGETSYKCASKIDSAYLDILDAILPAVPLCKDKNNKYIITKSGNFGQADTLVEIVNYFKKPEDEQI
ncbi:MAG: four-carbon acid sugar kinase family protein [Candidatus Gastranaerophilales bacterium]|nr:four-carbon acid sugar kinase family protein [Candidatus Gastranaerophilales bacterium]